MLTVFHIAPRAPLARTWNLKMLVFIKRQSYPPGTFFSEKLELETILDINPCDISIKGSGQIHCFCGPVDFDDIERFISVFHQRFSDKR